MKRRSFLRSTAAASAVLALPSLSSSRARAQASCDTSAGPLVITVEAQAGWDPTYHCDPHGDPAFSFFGPGAILTAGNIRYAPYLEDGTPYRYGPRVALDPGTVDGEDFFQKHGAKLCIINGVDNQTVSHDIGPRVAFSGSNREGLPTLSGLAAAARDPGAPLAFIASGGFAASAGLVPITRIGNNLNVLQTLTRPNFPQATTPASTQRFQEPAIEALVRQRQRARDERLLSRVLSRREHEVLRRVGASRGEAVSAQFDALAAALDGAGGASAQNPFVNTAGSVLAAMRSGACVAAHLQTGGFDTHDLHDSMQVGTGHRPALDRLFEGLDFLIDAIEADATLSARGVVIVVGSDFARTKINGDLGKDHWPVTSMWVIGLGAASTLVQGNRVVGQTFTRSATGGAVNGVRASKLALSGGDLVPTDDEDPQGITLVAGHVHLALRQAIGLCDDSELALKFPLQGLSQQVLPILKPV